jgi:hypothetical protein
MVAQSDKARIDELKRQVDAATVDRITPAVTNFFDRATPIVADATDKVRQQVEVWSAQVRDRPLLSLSLAAALGWVVASLRRKGGR